MSSKKGAGRPVSKGKGKSSYIAQKSAYVDMWKEDGTFDLKLDTVRGMRAFGYTIEQICTYLKISKTTLYSIARLCPEFNDVMNKGNEELYFKCIELQQHTLYNTEIPLEIRLQLAQRLETRYAHRYALDIDKEKEESKETNKEDNATFIFKIEKGIAVEGGGKSGGNCTD